MKALANLVLLVVVLAIGVWALVEVLMRDWLSSRDASAPAVDGVFAEMRAAVEAGCGCEDCTYIRVLLDCYGIPVEAA